MKGRLRREPSERCSHCGSFCRNRHVCNNDSNNNSPTAPSNTPGRVKQEYQQLDKLLTNAEAEMVRDGAMGAEGKREGRHYKDKYVRSQPKRRGRPKMLFQAARPLKAQQLPRPHPKMAVPGRASAQATIVATPSNASATGTVQGGESNAGAGSLDWLERNWDALPERDICSIQKWLMSGNDVSLPAVVQGIHDEFRLWQESGESIDGWIDLVGELMFGTDHTDLREEKSDTTAPVVTTTAKVVVESQPSADGQWSSMCEGQLLLPLPHPSPDRRVLHADLQ